VETVHTAVDSSGACSNRQAPYSVGTTNTGISRSGVEGDDGTGELGTSTDGAVGSSPGLVKINSRSGGVKGGGGGLEIDG
jgi:hypothetical protein